MLFKSFLLVPDDIGFEMIGAGVALAMLGIIVVVVVATSNGLCVGKAVGGINGVMPWL